MSPNSRRELIVAMVLIESNRGTRVPRVDKENSVNDTVNSGTMKQKLHIVLSNAERTFSL